VISLSNDDNNPNNSSGSSSSTSDCPSLESISITSNCNEISIHNSTSTDDVEVLEINAMAKVQLIEELKKWGLNTEPECAFGENAKLYVEGI